MIDIQAAGGLYDPISLEIFSDSMRKRIVQILTPLTASNLCGAIAQEQHLDVQAAAFADLTPQQKSVIASTDRMRHVGPHVVQCRDRKLMDVEDFGDAFTPNPEIAKVKFK